MKTLFRNLSIHVTLAVCILAGFTVISGQERPLSSITYRLSMSRPQSHLFEVVIEVELLENVPESLDLQMAKWSPGRYAVFDFAKNVQQVSAGEGICPHPQELRDGRTGPPCRPAWLPVNRVDDQTWRVETRGNSKI